MTNTQFLKLSRPVLESLETLFNLESPGTVCPNFKHCLDCPFQVHDRGCALALAKSRLDELDPARHSSAY